MCGCPGVCEGAASEFPLSPVASFTSVQRRVKGGAGLALAERMLAVS